MRVVMFIVYIIICSVFIIELLRGYFKRKEENDDFDNEVNKIGLFVIIGSFVLAGVIMVNFFMI